MPDVQTQSFICPSASTKTNKRSNNIFLCSSSCHDFLLQLETKVVDDSNHKINPFDFEATKSRLGVRYVVSIDQVHHAIPHVFEQGLLNAFPLTQT